MTPFSARTERSSLKPESYKPIAQNQKIYDQLYALYRAPHDAFGGVNKAADLSQIMKELIRIKEQQSS